MQRQIGSSRMAGFTLIETMVSVIIGSMLLTALYQIWTSNQRETDRIQDKTEFRDRAALATTQVNRSITMAGFGMSKMDVIAKGVGNSCDTLKIYSNPSEIRTTLIDTARISSNSILVFKDSGFTVGGLIGITDSIHQEYVRVSQMSGDTASGYTVTLASALANLYLPGVPDIYPVQKELIYIDDNRHSLIRKLDSRQINLVTGINDFRIDMRDAFGNPATSYRKIRVVTFNVTGTYKAPAGTPSTMSFSSTVIPRNIL